MRAIAAVSVAVLIPISVASEPGHPLDCADWVFSQPGLRCSVHLARGQVADGSSWLTRGTNSVVLNEGVQLQIRRQQFVPPEGNVVWRTSLITFDGQQETEVAFVQDRRVPGQSNRYSFDRIRPTSCRLQVCQDGSCPTGQQNYCDLATNVGNTCIDCSRPDMVLQYDPVRGRVLIPLFSDCEGCPPTAEYGTGWWVASIEGFTTLYEVMQSYTPTATLGFRVPTHPEGLPDVDHFDTYTGRVTQPLDLSQAQPLMCGYPPQPPQPGDYFTLPDIPVPAPGHAWYVLTAATSGAEHRAGRKVNGHGRLVGRDARQLPACVNAGKDGVR